jgi:hypothetical protein
MFFSSAFPAPFQVKKTSDRCFAFRLLFVYQIIRRINRMEHVVTERCYCKENSDAREPHMSWYFLVSFLLSTSSFYQTLGGSYTTEHFRFDSNSREVLMTLRIFFSFYSALFSFSCVRSFVKESNLSHIVTNLKVKR